MFHSEYTKSGSASFCSSQSNDSRGPQDDLYAALPLLHDCQEQPILSIQTEQERNPESIQSPTREGSLSGRVSSAAETLTFLVGTHFIYGTSLLIMKLNTTPGKSTFFTWGLRAFSMCVESVSVCVFKRLRSCGLGTDGVTAWRITRSRLSALSVCSRQRNAAKVSWLFYLGIAQNSLLPTQPEGFKVNSECVCRQSCIGLLRSNCVLHESERVNRPWRCCTIQPGLHKTAHINHALPKRLHPHPKGVYTAATLDVKIKT